ncbi:MAG: S1 RNA-binding domain-containing protein [Elusimicrobiota bacterium]|nr:S1 RNA-binding domain-containing protein [Elusimicrobiota bacterium]
MTDKIDDEISFKDAISSISEPHTGEIVTAKIVAINSSGVLVNLGLKTEGIIPVSEFGQRGIPDDFAEGKEIPIMLLEGKTFGYQNVSYREARQRIAFKHLKNCYIEGKPVKGEIVKKVKGGFIVDIGIDAFLPRSQAEKSTTKEIKLLITKFDERKKSVVVSQKKYIEFEKKQAQEKFFSSVSVGDTVEGKVTTICNFGVFVDLGGVEGLVHISDLAWYRVDKPEDVVRVGEKLKLKVLKVDKEGKKISLGLKQLLSHPWEKVEEKYPVGSEVTGRVISHTNFGAFVELEPGVEGLLHISELSWTQKDITLKDVLKIGENYRLKVVEVNPKEEKISLSLKRMQENPWEKLKNEYPPKCKIRCKVVKLLPFGAFVELPYQLEGLIHIQDMSWLKKVKHPKEVVEIGDEIDAVLLEVRPEEEKAIVSIKHLTEDPFEKYHLGKTVKGIVNKTVPFGAYIKLDNEIEAFLHKLEVSRDKEKSIDELLQIGQEIEAKVIRSDRISKKIELSIRKLEIDRERELIEKYSAVARPQLSEILEEKET